MTFTPEYLRPTDRGFESDTSDSETDDTSAEENDTLLRALRVGMNTIRSHTRETLANCESEESCSDLAGVLESSTLKLMRQQKTYLQTSQICVGIIDEVCDDLDDIETQEPGGNGDGEQNVNNNEAPIWDVKLTPSLPSLEVVILTREKMSQMFDQRMQTYNDSFTDEDLKTQADYTALQKEINLGREDFERKQIFELSNELDQAEQDDEDVFVVAASIALAKGEGNNIDYGEESP